MRTQKIKLFFALLIVVGACTKPDAQFGSPEATLQTLFTAYGANHMTEAEARARLANREHFQLQDAALYRQCFADWLGPQDEGLAGYVFGSLLAAKDSLSFQKENQKVLVRTKRSSGEIITLAVMTQDNGKWKVLLRESVPEEVRQRLYEVYQDARRVGN